MAATSPSPVDIVRRFMTDMERLDYDSALKLVSDACEYVNPAPFPVVHGPAGIRGILEPFFAPTLENEFKVLREALSGPTVFLERLDRHRLADKWVELPVTGVFEVHDGKITFWRDYFDVATIMSQWPSQ
ncbi:MAG: limonene-1,2-epoxide hydrolase family protein [Phenylobacterium sp.]